jgi:hypothetical protein
MERRKFTVGGCLFTWIVKFVLITAACSLGWFLWAVYTGVPGDYLMFMRQGYGAWIAFEAGWMIVQGIYLFGKEMARQRGNTL